MRCGDGKMALMLPTRTDPKASGPRGISIILVESGLAGYRVGRPLEKVGRHGQDVCELYFEVMRVPTSNLLGPAEAEVSSK